MSDPLGNFEKMTDRELLVASVVRQGHTTSALEALVAKVGEQNGRIAVLEGWRWYVVGMIAILVAAIPLIPTLMWMLGG